MTRGLPGSANLRSNGAWRDAEPKEETMSKRRRAAGAPRSNPSPAMAYASPRIARRRRHVRRRPEHRRFTHQCGRGALEEPQWSLSPGKSRLCCRNRRASKPKSCARSSNPKGDARTQHAAPRCRCSTARSRRTRCTSPSIIREFRISIRKSTCGHPWHGQAAAQVHARRADALPYGHPQAFR